MQIIIKYDTSKLCFIRLYTFSMNITTFYEKVFKSTCSTCTYIFMYIAKKIMEILLVNIVFLYIRTTLDGTTK